MRREYWNLNYKTNSEELKEFLLFELKMLQRNKTMKLWSKIRSYITTTPSFNKNLFHIVFHKSHRTNVCIYDIRVCSVDFHLGHRYYRRKMKILSQVVGETCLFRESTVGFPFPRNIQISKCFRRRETVSRKFLCPFFFLKMKQLIRF